MKRTPVKPIPAGTLRTQLARSQAAHPRPDIPHPGADLLTAFAENTLLDRERTELLAHLAACPACRAIVHTAGAAEPEPAPLPQPLPSRAPLRTWLAVAALTACLFVMAASTVFFYRAMHLGDSRMRTAAAPPPSLPAPPPPAAAVEGARRTTATPAPAGALPARQHIPASAHPHPPAPQSAEPAAAFTAPPAPAPENTGASAAVSLGILESPRPQNAPLDKSQLQVEQRTRVSAVHGAVAEAKAAPQPASSAAVRIAPANTFASSAQATQTLSGLVPALSPRPRFRITGAGQIERSVQSSIWMPVAVAPDTHFRALAISGSDVWAGGDHLRLFHSADNGLNWTEVQLPAGADREHAIAHIRIDSPQQLTVEDEAGGLWTTSDAGATWK